MPNAKLANQKIGTALAVFVLLGASVLFFYHLGSEPLRDYDEATYAEVVHEAFTNHDFLSFTYNQVHYFRKPPLLFWLIGASEKASPSITAAVRFPSALAGLALVALVMLFVCEVSRNWYGAALAGAVLATTAPFLDTARQSRFDVLVALFIVLAGYFFFRALSNPRWFLAFGLAAGLAVLSKSVIAVFAGVFVILIALFLRRFDWLKNAYFWAGVGVFFLVAGPWHLYETLRFGGTFWQSYFGAEVVSRVQQNIFSTVTITNGDYISYLLQFTAPWIWIFFALCIVSPIWFRRLNRDERVIVLSSAGTLATMIAIFVFAATKAVTYLAPLYPFAAIIIAIVVPRLFAGGRAAIAASIAAAAIIAYAVPTCIYNAYHVNPYFRTELQLAREETQVGQTLLHIEGSAPLYIFDDENLGVIKFYSRNFNALALEPLGKPASGSYLVLNSSATSTFARSFPALRTQSLFSGTQISLLKITEIR